MSIARRVRPERWLNGRGAYSSAMPAAVLSVYSGRSASSGETPASSANSSSSSSSSSSPPPARAGPPPARPPSAPLR